MTAAKIICVPRGAFVKKTYKAQIFHMTMLRPNKIVSLR